MFKQRKQSNIFSPILLFSGFVDSVCFFRHPTSFSWECDLKFQRFVLFFLRATRRAWWWRCSGESFDRLYKFNCFLKCQQTEWTALQLWDVKNVKIYINLQCNQKHAESLTVWEAKIIFIKYAKLRLIKVKLNVRI